MEKQQSNVFFVKTPNTYINSLEYKHKYAIDDKNYLVIFNMRKYGVKVAQLNKIIDNKQWEDIIVINIQNDKFRYFNGLNKIKQIPSKGIKSIVNIPPIISNIILIKSLKKAKKKLEKKFHNLEVFSLISSNDTLRDLGEKIFTPKKVILIDKASSASRGQLSTNQSRIDNQKSIYKLFCKSIAPEFYITPTYFTAYPGAYKKYNGQVLKNEYSYFSSLQEKYQNKKKTVSILGMPQIEKKIHFTQFLDWVTNNYNPKENCIYYFPHPREKSTDEKIRIMSSKGVHYVKEALPIEIEYLFGRIKGCICFISTHYTSAYTFLQKASSNTEFILISHEKKEDSEAVKSIGNVQYENYKNDPRFKFVIIPNYDQTFLY